MTEESHPDGSEIRHCKEIREGVLTYTRVRVTSLVGGTELCRNPRTPFIYIMDFYDGSFH